MRQIYYYDTSNNNKFTGTDVVEDNHQLLVGETYIKPSDGLHWPLYFDQTVQRWHGVTEEQWLASKPFHNDGPSGPSSQQKLNSVLTTQVAMLTQTVNQLKTQLNSKEG